MVIPRSRSRSIESSTCSRICRGSTGWVSSRMRSASVDLPGSMCGMIEKWRMWRWSAIWGPRLEGLDRLREPLQEHRGLLALVGRQRLVEAPAPRVDLLAPRAHHPAALRGERDVHHAAVARARRAGDEARGLEAV